ncbi:MAG: asparagine synthase (glutamine-hydrolyzing) [bacterium]
MCGIVGVVDFKNFSRSDKWLSQLNKASNAIIHRGRNGQGLFINSENSCFFAHRRLAILDLSNRSDQPMHSLNDRYTIVFNGEIYNYKELKLFLEKEGLSFSTTSDTEVLLKGYIFWGEKVLEKLNGIFAFSIWDDKEKTLFAARDRLGVKPFYWFKKSENYFIFASELKALMQFDVIEKKIDKEALDQYLSFYSVNAPLTMIKDVFILPPATFLKFNCAGMKIEKYWNLNQIKVDENIVDFNQASNLTREAFCNSIELQMRSDIPVGAFLSGGLDSGIIVGAMSKFTFKKIDTFTVGFDDYGKNLDESFYAQLVAKKFNCQHHQLNLNSKIFKDNFQDFIFAIDHPSGDGFNSFYVSKLASNNVSVAMSGIGGDELFLGYRYFYDFLKRQEFCNSFINSKIFNLGSYFYFKNRILRSLAYRFGYDFLKFKSGLIESYFEQRSLFNSREKKLLISDKFNLYNIELNEFIKKNNLIIDSKDDGLNTFSKLELSFYTPNMLLLDMDSVSMFSTLEVRVPFLDHKLVELALKIPDKFKIFKDQKTNKPLLVSLFKDFLPQEILSQRKKGFEMPIGFWLKNEFKSELLEMKNFNLFNSEYIDYLLDEFYKDPRNYLKVWSLFVLFNWIKKNNFEI